MTHARCTLDSGNWRSTATLCAALAATFVPSLAFCPNPLDELPETIELTAIIRDFRAVGDGGHVDFENTSLAGGFVSVGLVENQLDDDNLPVFRHSYGQKIYTEWRDSSGRPINPAMYDPDRGDTAGSFASVTTKRISSADSYRSWFRDVPGVNMTVIRPLTMHRQGETNVYVFDSTTDPYYVERGGFFPINGELFGNYSTTGRNFHFTTEVRTRFTFHANQNPIFKFTGDDDVWVFIDGKLVIDLGGRHPIREQHLDLNRLDWLVDGEEYSLVIFHAERKVTQSNFRIETTLTLDSANNNPAVSAVFD